LDLKKAFDVCSHKVLLRKLANFGVGGVARDWFSSYLGGRSQKVDIGGYLSLPIRLGEISVIQGSILGPTLFNIYINDLPLATSLHTSMFADDTQCIAGGGDLSSLIDLVNSELRKLASWFRANRMVVNAEKSHYIIFHTKGKKIDMMNKNILFDNNNPNLPHNPLLVSPLSRIHTSHPDKKMRSFKLLGVMLDENLSFQAQSDALLAKLNRAVYMINRVKNILPPKALVTLYHSLFHCHLNYCPTIYSSTSKTNIDKLVKLQKKVVRIITHSHYHAHTEPLFSKLQILTVPALIQKAKLMFMHSVYHGYASPSFLGHWTRNEERDIQYNLRFNGDFETCRIKYASLSNLPLFTFPACWNVSSENRYIRTKFTYNIALLAELLPPNPANPTPT
jgi:hypothetical protein